jgi:hypothetical protein
MPARFREHFVAETRSITSEKWHEIQRSLLRLAQRVKRSARRSDLLHDVSVLFLRRGD